MSSNRKWQQMLLDDLSASLRAEEVVKALFLTGSLADDTLAVDEWSDVDLTAIVADDAIAGLFSCASWLERHGEVIGLGRHDSPEAKTLRVCLAPCRRADISLVPESVLEDQKGDDNTPATRAHALLWSKVPQIGPHLSGLFPRPAFSAIPIQDVATIVESFCVKASIAIAKTVRNDLLIGLHLALDLARDCLVLQMHRRDRDKGTNIHRFGGFGNDVVARLYPGTGGASPLEILKLVERSAKVLDELAPDLLPAYKPRAKLLLPGIRQAESACAARTKHVQEGEQSAGGDAKDRAPQP